jgi:hypothetical protein
MEKKSIILFFIFAFLIFILGGGTGVFYQSQKCPLNIENTTDKTAIFEKAVKDLSSKTIYFIVAYGDVTDIQGRDITINNNGENLTIKIKEDAKITSFKVPAVGETSSDTETPAKFEDIKNGNNLRISLRVFSDGQITGDSVIIMR